MNWHGRKESPDHKDQAHGSADNGSGRRLWYRGKPKKQALLFGGRQAGGEDFMITRTVNVKMSKNLSASPAALLVQKASKYDSIIYIESGERKVNAKSIMGMMSITIDEGDELMIKCDGSDENDAMSAMEGFLTGAMA